MTDVTAVEEAQLAVILTALLFAPSVIARAAACAPPLIVAVIATLALTDKVIGDTGVSVTVG